ncbi:SDR family oxidoreductase [Priestia endophytica]|uniref:SDR family oxidoreductase n=1 Tax=Priestia endophytica TaxID=135735 RepID=UPI000DCFC5DD|nr:SDR family oxidoreductase [Priestia endophytica]
MITISQKGTFVPLYQGQALAKPEKVASLVIWLCSPAASYIIDQGIAVDGGYTVH